MTLMRKSLLTGAVAVIAIIAGFIFLLKGCLAKYDERFMRTPALVFEKNGSSVIFSIVEFQKTTSYSRKGNFVRKSVNTNYYTQTNDGHTGDMLTSKKIKNHKEIKNFPVEVLGASGNSAWLFAGELMAFNAFTLDKTADIEMLEEKNPPLKGKFPKERQYYLYNRNDSNIYFTASDGTKWQLNTRTLTASSSSYRKDESPLQYQLSLLEKSIKQSQDELDSLYQQKNYRASADYRAKKITAAEYQQITKTYYAEREQLGRARDSLQNIKRQWEKNKRKMEDTERTIEHLQRFNPSFSSMKINQDTLAAAWFGLYSDEEMSKLNNWVTDQTAYDETVRRKLFAGAYSFSRNEDAVIDKPSVKTISPVDFLAGGFLLDKRNAKPIYLQNGQLLLVAHKDQVGKDGKILLTSLGRDGKTGWTLNTNLSDWSDWIYHGNYLYVFGMDNKNLSSGENNILLCIDLSKGTAAKFDYFKNKKAE